MDNINENQESSFTFKDIVFLIRKHLFPIILFTLVGLSLGTAHSFASKQSYVSKGTLMATPIDGSGSTGTTASAYSYLEYVSKTFVELASEDVVLGEVSQRLSSEYNIDLSPKQIKNGISASASSLIINVSYTQKFGHGADPSSTKVVVSTLIHTMEDIALQVDENGEPVYKLLYGNLKVLSDGSEPTKESHAFRDIIIGTAGGLVAAALYIILFEVFDNKFKSTDEIERMMNVPVLAGIPYYDLGNGTDEKAKRSKTNNANNKQNEYKIITKVDPTSIAAEAYRRLKVDLNFSTPDKKNKVIQMCSAIQGEGKSMTILNLAQTYVEDKKKVIIVDLDFRRPKVHRSHNISNRNGVLEYLTGKVTLKEAIKHKEGYSDILNSGGQSEYPSSLLQGDGIENLFNELRNLYDYILVDCPPVLAVSDAVAISRYVDTAVFVINQSKTPKYATREAIKILRQNNVNVAGVSFCFMKKNEKYHSNYYSKYSYYQSYKYENRDSLDEEESLTNDDKLINSETNSD